MKDQSAYTSDEASQIAYLYGKVIERLFQLSAHPKDSTSKHLLEAAIKNYEKMVPESLRKGREGLTSKIESMTVKNVRPSDFL